MAIHFRFGGSTIERTVACPGWRKLADTCPELPRTNEHANRGSALHEAAEECLNDGLPTGPFIGRHYPEFDYTLTADDVDDLETAVQAANEVMDKYNCVDFVTEAMVVHGAGVGGSADLIACGDEYVCVIDYKMGIGFVDVEANKQLAFYAMCAMNTKATAWMFEGKRLVVAIVQPKVSRSPSVYEFEPEEFDLLCKQMLAAVEAAEGDNPSLNPGPSCKYCPAAPYCPAKRGQAMQFLRLNPKQSASLAEGMLMVEEMKEQIKAIEAEVFAALENGEQVPGFKLVLKQSRRHWIDEEATELMLRKANLPESTFMKSELLSVAQLEKALKKTGREINLENFFTSSSSGTTIAPETDKRPAVQGRSEIPAALAAVMMS